MSTTQLPSAPPPVWEGVSATKRALWRAEGILYRRRDWFIVGALIVLAVAIRIWINRGLWLDEATTVAQARMDFFRMISYMRQSDVHPPLFQTIMWGNIRIFGDSEFAIRIPSLVFGTLLVPVLYGAGRDLFNRRTGLIAALFAAIGPVTVWYSQEARMYPIFILFAALTIWAQVRAVRTGSNKAWVAYTVFTALLMWTHYFSVLHVVVQQVAFFAIMFMGRKDGSGKAIFKKWSRSIVALVLLMIPLIYIALGQVSNYGVRDTSTTAGTGAGEDGSPIYTAISNIASAIIGYHSADTMTAINALWPLAMLAAVLTLGRGRTRVTAMLTALIFVPLAVLFVIGFSRNDVFELRYFAGAVPAIILLLSRSATLVAKGTKSLVAIVVAMVLVLGIALYDEQSDGGDAKSYNFKEAFGEINAARQPGDLLIYAPFYLHPTANYYAADIQSAPLVAGLDSVTEQNRIFVVGSFAFAEAEVTRQQVDQVNERLAYDRELVAHRIYNNVETWEWK